MTEGPDRPRPRRRRAARHALRHHRSRPPRGEHRPGAAPRSPPPAATTARTSRPTRSRRSPRCRSPPAPIGITCQKVSEAEVFARPASPTTSSISFNIVGDAQGRPPDGPRRARSPRLAVVADNETVLDGLSAGARRRGRDAAGARRMRHRLRPQRRADPGRPRWRSPASPTGCRGLRFAGLMVFPEHGARDAAVLHGGAAPLRGGRRPGRRCARAAAPRRCAARRLPDDDRAPRRHLRLQRRDDDARPGVATCDDCALHVRATVVSRPTEDRAIIDAGSKVLTREQYYVKNFGQRGRIPRRRGLQPLGGARHDRPRRQRRAARRSARWSASFRTTAAWSRTWSTRSTACATAPVELVWPVAARGKVR